MSLSFLLPKGFNRHFLLDVDDDNSDNDDNDSTMVMMIMLPKDFNPRFYLLPAVPL